MNGQQIVIRILLIFCTSYKRMLIRADCGLPAIPDSTRLNIFRQRYEEETKITYECEAKNNELIEGKYRTCVNHRWNGPLPRCAIAVGVGRIALRGIRIEESGKHRTIYRQLLSRSIHKRSNKRTNEQTRYVECDKTKFLWNIYQNQTWKFQLTREYSFNYFVLYMRGGFLLENKNDDNLSLEASVEDTVSLKLCRLQHFSLTDDAITYKIGFVCDSVQHPISVHEGIDESVQELIINVYTKQLNVTTTFCALKLYTLSDSCGSPEKPLNSVLLAREKTYSVYSCREGYYIEGVQKVRCGLNGKWMDEFPLCKPYRTCKIPAIDTYDPFLHVQYKHVYKVDQSSYAEPDDVAIYACLNVTNTTRMLFKGETTRICKDGKWSGSQPTCQPLANMSALEMMYLPPQEAPQNNHVYNKLHTVIVAMLGSFIVGGVSVAIVIYLVVRRRAKSNKRTKISIVIDETEDLEYDKPQEYASFRSSRFSDFSNEIINPLYEDFKRLETAVNVPVQSIN